MLIPILMVGLLIPASMGGVKVLEEKNFQMQAAALERLEREEAGRIRMADVYAYPEVKETPKKRSFRIK